MELENAKLYSFDDAITFRERLRTSGKHVVLTNGCFDLLHTGHLFFLQKAAEEGDCLFVALNSAKSIHILKGPSRPIQGDTERAYALSCLYFVDAIVLFDTPRLDREILALKPDVYVKAGDYSSEKLDPAERKALESINAQIRFLPFLQGYSTTSLIAKIREVE
jgi:D-glycero-beta-D-manno-heptose 1-phosphate adenylyltransferase